ncbi:MAG: helix-turn-helix transcriptional regulator [Clostridia bacterium]|nr:helix-turn-helix transcriptional regulator [Clostridia bacterium]
MLVNFNENLRALRKQKGNTQEELARFLNISVQSVSKWECGDGHPDITLLPLIASYYSVTIDTLFGVSEIEKQKRIREISDNYYKIRVEKQPDGTLLKQKGINEGIELIRNGLKEYPNDYWLMQVLASDLWWKSKSCENSEKLKLLEEAEILCDRIMQGCTETMYRNSAESILCMIYNDSGRYEKALEIASRSCDICDTVGWRLANILKGDELIKRIRKNIKELTMYLYLSIIQMKENSGSLDFESDSEFQIILDTINKELGR